MQIIISNHGYERLRERNGWNKKTSDRMISRIFNKPCKDCELKNWKKKHGKEYIRKQESGKILEIRFFGDNVYIFDMVDNNAVLVTSYGYKSNYSKKEAEDLLFFGVKKMS